MASPRLRHDGRGEPEVLGLRLTDREAQMIQLVAQAKSNREIAAEMGLSYGSVRVYLSRAYEKLGIHDRQHAMRWVLTGRP